jgi:hypothetical protein
VIRDKYHLGKSVKFYPDNLKTQYLIFTQNCIVAIADVCLNGGKNDALKMLDLQKNSAINSNKLQV